MKSGIVLEGGAFRTIYSSGVCDAFLDAALMPDYVIGVSAGIAYGVSYVSRQKRRNLQIICNYANDPRYMGAGNLLGRKNRSYFGLDFAYDRIPNELVPFDYDAFAAYPGQVEAVVTNLESGRAEYLPVPPRDDHFLILRATCALPLLFPIFYLDGMPCLDGGCSDAIPWQRAFDCGCERIVAVLTRERSYVRGEEKLEKLIDRKYRKWPNFLDTMHRRADDYNESRRKLFEAEKSGRAMILAPRSTADFSRTERDLEKIRALWQNGYFDGRAAAPAVRGFWAGR